MQKKILLDIDTFFNDHFSGIMRESYYLYKILSENNGVDIKVPFIGKRYFREKVKHYIPIKLPEVIIQERFQKFYNSIMGEGAEDKLINQTFYTFYKKRGALQNNAESGNRLDLLHRIKRRIQEKIMTFTLEDKIKVENHSTVIFPFLSPTQVIGSKKIIRHHDIIPFEIFEESQFADDFRYALKKAVKNTHHFVCNSKDTEYKLLQLYPEVHGKTSVIYVPVEVEKILGTKTDALAYINSSISFEFENSEKTKKISHILFNNQKNLVEKLKDNESELNYFIFISDITERKQCDKILKAFLKVSQDFPEYKLIIVGKNATHYDSVTNYLIRLINEQKAFYLFNLDVKALHTLINYAEALISFSSHEGFGIPPAEALMLDTPIILSDISVYKEIYEDAAIMAKSDSVDCLANKMIEFINNGGKVNWQNTVDYKRVCKKFSYNLIANQWNELLKKENLL